MDVLLSRPQSGPAAQRSLGERFHSTLIALLWVLICWCGLITMGHAGQAQALAEDPVLEQRMVDIAQELRCLVCQNESLASSRADLAEDLRREVRTLLKQGKSDEDIKAYLVARYGDFVLYRPQVKPLTWVLWFGPMVAMLLGLLGLVVYLKRGQSTRAQGGAQPLSEEERARLAVLMKDGRGL
jgi:cytochrome c-type biogenesis protein CcmH